jgi:hypothetical protein
MWVSRLRRSISNHSGTPNVQYLRKSRYRIVHGLDPDRRFLRARRRRTRRRARGVFDDGSLCTTRRFGGGGKCADQRCSAWSWECGWTEQYDGRSQRHRQCSQDGNAATAADSRPGAARSVRTPGDERRTAIDGGDVGGTSPAARQSSALAEKRDGSEQSRQPGKRGAR